MAVEIRELSLEVVPSSEGSLISTVMCSIHRSNNLELVILLHEMSRSSVF